MDSDALAGAYQNLKIHRTQQIKAHDDLFDSNTISRVNIL